MLSPSELQQYQREGYVVPNWAFAPSELAAMRTALDDLLEANPGLASDNLICPHLVNAGKQGLKGSPRWLEFARTKSLTDRVAALIGEDIILWGTTLFGKPAAVGKATPWHQDGQYWPINPLATCTAWIALDDCTVENGCLRVLPRSHIGQKVFSHRTNESHTLTLNQELEPTSFDESAAVDVPLKAGQCVLFDVYLVHGSQANTSAKRRAGFVCRFMPASSKFEHDGSGALEARSGIVEFQQRALYLVHGSNPGANDMQRGHVKA